MKRTLIWLVVLVAVVIGGLLAAPMFIPAEVYRDQVTRAVKKATGRTLAIGGEVSLSLFPSVAVRLDDVSLSNAPGATEKTMAKLERLVLDVQVVPLLGGDLRLDSFVLVKPVIHLEKSKSGKGNWEFGKAAPAKSETAEAGGGLPLGQISLGDVRLEDGRVTFTDHSTGGKRIEISDIDLALSLPGIDKPFSAKGGVTWNQERVKLNINARNPKALLSGMRSAVGVKVDSSKVSLAFDGRAAMAAKPEAGGTVTLDVPSIRALAEWAGAPIAMEGNGLGPARISGVFSLKGDDVAFKEAKIAIDAIEAAGEVAVNAAGKRPRIKGKVATGVLDLNPYLPAPKEKPAEDGGPGKWDDAPIDLSGLKQADAELTLSVAGIRMNEIKIGKSELAVSLKGGVLKADLARMALYDGNGTAAIGVDARNPKADVSLAFDVDGVQAAGLLKDVGGIGWLEGTAKAKGRMKTQGASQLEFVKGLGGNANFSFTDGAIIGINLAAMVRNAASAFLDPTADEIRKTDFAELSGSVKIANGIARNDDLAMKSPLLRITGAGTVDMPARMVDYRVEPKMVASLEGQGGDDKLGLAVPVKVSGPWHDVGFAPDLAALGEKALEAPGEVVKEVKGTAKGVVDKVKSVKEGGVEGVVKGVGGLLGGDKKGEKKPAGDDGNPLNKVKGLFGK